ncbi:MAG TPA: Lpg1974 family pore-forming outer membrane protein [Gemmataceae bacterium]|nr:Lpg1974 family pore-forming outer membrane protein [Gemmataceae bacterium]
MNRRTALAVGTLALSWLGGVAAAGDLQSPYMASSSGAAGSAPLVDVGRPPADVPPPARESAPLFPSNDYDGRCCGRGAHLTGGAGLYIMQPHFESNPAFFSIQTTSTAVPTRVVNAAVQQDFSTEMAVAPQVWFGLVSDSGLGLRTRWWHFDQSYRQTTTNPAQPDPTITMGIDSAAPLGLRVTSSSNIGLADPLSFSSNLKITVWDLEATQDLHLGKCALLLSGGIRYAHLSQDYNAARARSGLAPDGIGGSIDFTVDADTLRSGHNFNGAGPVFGLEVHRPIGGTGLALYGSSRGSLLFGDGKQRAFQLTVQQGTTEFGLPVDLIAFNSASSTRHDLLPIAELEVGLEFARDLGRGRLFAQTALVGQVWFGADNAARSTTADTLGVLRGGTIEESNLGFIGLSIRAGVDF